MFYSVLFVGIPVLGIASYLSLVRHMLAAHVPSPPTIPLFCVFAAYDAVVLFGISELFRVWSGMHSLAAIGLVFVGLPWLIVQGFLLRRTSTLSVYHRVTVILSFAFPVALALLLAWVAVR